MTPPKETPRRLPRCLDVTQGNNARASAYRPIVREFEDAFRKYDQGLEFGYFPDIMLLFLPESRALLIASAERRLGRTLDIPSSPRELDRRVEDKGDEAIEALQKDIRFVLRTPMARDLMHQAQWILNGRRVYDLSPTLFASFVETDFSRLKGADIPVPLRGFYVHLPDAKSLGIEREGCVFDGAYVRWVLDENNNPSLDVMLIFLNMEDALEELYIDTPISLYGDVEERLKEMQVRADPDNVKFCDQFVRLIIGLCFYLSCDDADVERQHFGPSPDLKARAKKLGGAAGKKLLQMGTIPVHYLRVGHRFETRSVELESLAAADKETRKLLKRHVVRGHFRQQPCGPGRQERKTVFVRSFWKGPPWGEAVGAIHKIRESPPRPPRPPSPPSPPRPQQAPTSTP